MQQFNLVPEVILRKMFADEEVHNIQLLGKARSGCSGPKVVFLKNGTPDLLALKYGDTRVPIQTQVENWGMLEPFLSQRLPKVLHTVIYDGGQAMLMEAINGPNLHETVMLGILPEEYVLKIVSSILAEFQKMWMLSQSKDIPFSECRRPRERLGRVLKAVVGVLRELGIALDDNIVVNGEDLGPIQVLLGHLEGYQPPDFSVVCHSDLNGDNFIIDMEEKDWYLVDWEWVGRHDWRLSMSHFMGWWLSNGTKLRSIPVMKQESHWVELTYELGSPTLCRKIQEKATTFCYEAAHALGDDNWLGQFPLLLAGLLLGDVRFIEGRDRNEYLLPLLGEGFRILAQQDSDSILKV